MKRLTFFLLLTILATPAIAQKEFSSVEEQMTGKEFAETGLVKLSPDELAALNAWLRAHSVATLEVARMPTGDSRGFEDTAISAMDGSDIITRIKGPFSGWDGATVFELENGMIWKQTETSTFAIAEVENPTIVLEKGAFGVWRLYVEGYNRKVRVERSQ
jgi:hypothetical protein